jgi:hypothetical protein
MDRIFTLPTISGGEKKTLAKKNDVQRNCYKNLGIQALPTVTGVVKLMSN